jgi:hypothetical protein
MIEDKEQRSNKSSQQSLEGKSKVYCAYKTSLHFACFMPDLLCVQQSEVSTFAPPGWPEGMAGALEQLALEQNRNRTWLAS